jgi:DNA-binding transcriptional MocR family regulator
LDTVREQYKLRRDAAMQAVRRYGGMDFEFEVPEGGFYLWCTLHSVCSPAALLYESARKGVSFVPGDVFYADEQNKHQVRLCFTTHSPEKITEGIKRLSLAVKEAAKGNMKSKRFPGQNIPII